MRDDRPGLTPDGLYWLSKRPRSDYWHRTWFDVRERQTKRTTLRTEVFQSAHEALIEWWVENRRIVDAKPETVSIAEVLIRYYDQHAQKLPSAEQARIACRKLSDACGDLSVSEFTMQEQRKFITAMQEGGSSPGYIRRTLSVGKAALTWAWHNGVVTIIPTVKLPQDGPGRDRVLTMPEMHALVEHATEDHIYRFVVLAFATMARPDAILDLDRERCDLSRRLIVLNPDGRKQTKKFRPTVPLVDAAFHVITDIPTGSIVRWRDKPIADIKTAWRRLRARAGLDDGVIPYSVRHTMATMVRSRGVPPWEIEGWLGHKRPGSSERYAKYAPDYMSHAAIAINSFMQELPLHT
jgi:integrase